jgi:hypothetical protein
MHLRCVPLWRLWPPALGLLLLAMAGCDDSGVGKTYPVSGKVLFDGNLLTTAHTVVLFKPDTSRGNTSPFEPTGIADSEGRYKLVTNGKKGAPPGWYKVIVTAAEGSIADSDHPKTRHPGPRSILPAKYGQAKTTPISIEVVENPAPDAYDLKLSSTEPPGT